jgi:uncharacterized protein YjbJ (UPF0337 family)
MITRCPFRHPKRVAAMLLLAALMPLRFLPAQLAPVPVPADPAAAPAVAPSADVVPDVTADSSALGVRQQRVKRMLLELDRKFAEIAEKLKAEQPEQAEKLDQAFKQSKEMLLEQRMDEITRMLDGAKLETATEEQQAMIDDVKELINMLLTDDEDTDPLEQDLKELQEWKQKLDELIAKEKELQKDSEVSDNKDAAMKDIDERIAALKDLIARQDAVKEDAEKQAGEPSANQDALDELADRQTDLRKETSEMADELATQADETDPTKKAAEPGLQPLREASGSQKESEQQLGDGKPKEAGEQAGEASKKLAEALEQLEKERERIAQMGPGKNDELAKDQQDAQSETGELNDKIAQSRQASEGSPNLQGAQQNLGKAQESMGEASKDLAQQKPGEASQDQGEAREELEKAREEIEKRIEELQDQKKEEQLAKLEEIFREMLERQQKATAGTLAIDTERKDAADGQLKRSLRIALRKWATEEKALAEKSSETYDLIYEEDQSVVFRTIVENLTGSIESVAEMMDEQKSDGYVQSSQQEIEKTLEELIAALEKAQDQQQAQNEPKEGQPGQQGKEPLLPPSAELKLLRLAQLRVNRLTTDFDQNRAGKEIDDGMRKELRKMAMRQLKLGIMAEEIASRGAVGSLEEID